LTLFVVRKIHSSSRNKTDNYLLAPLEVIASFPKPNYVNPETHGPALLLLAIILGSIGLVVVGTRLYARIYITKAVGIDDILIVGALIFGIATSILVIIGNTTYYSGYHVWDIPFGSAVGHRLNVWICQLCFMIALSCVKVSVLLFYRRLSVSCTKTFLIATWVGIAYNVAFLCGFMLALVLACRPLQAYWLSFDLVWPQNNDYKCGSERVAQPLVCLLSVIGDFYSAILPMTLVSRLAMPKTQKRALYALFGLAFLVVVAGVIRAVYLYRVVNVTYDFTWTLWKVWLLGEIELWFGVYVASAPALKPYFKQYLADKLHSQTSFHGKRRKVCVVRNDGHGGLGRVDEYYIDLQDARAVSPPNQEDVCSRYTNTGKHKDTYKCEVTVRFQELGRTESPIKSNCRRSSAQERNYSGNRYPPKQLPEEPTSKSIATATGDVNRPSRGKRY
jgi:hypothetical protein